MRPITKLASRRLPQVVTVGVLLAGAMLLIGRRGSTAPGSFMHLDQKIAYDRAGTGSIVILVPGLHRGQSEFAQIKQTLVATHDVITFDLLGQGGSSCPDINYNAETQVEVLGALMASLNVTTAHIVGFGEGGTIAAKFAAANPTKVKSLALLSAMDLERYDTTQTPINVNMAPPGSPGFLYRRFFPPTSVNESFKLLAAVMASRPSSPMVNPPTATGLFAANINGGCYLGGRMGDKNRINSWFTQAEANTLRTALPAVPVGLFWGDGDQLLAPGDQTPWKTALPAATVVPITLGAAPSCGHDFINECPAVTSSALNTFFTANGG